MNYKRDVNINNKICIWAMIHDHCRKEFTQKEPIVCNVNLL